MVPTPTSCHAAGLRIRWLGLFGSMQRQLGSVRYSGTPGTRTMGVPDAKLYWLILLICDCGAAIKLPLAYRRTPDQVQLPVSWRTSLLLVAFGVRQVLAETQ